MKTTKQFILTVALMLLFIIPSAVAQDNDAPKRPQYITVTTLHWNMDLDDFNMDEWIATEKEYLDKVTMKNELVMGSSVYMHRYTPDNRELLVVSAYANWEDIDKSNDRDDELVQEAWPDKAAREAYFKKKNSYYANFHSDEIYATMSGAKLMTEKPGDDMILYVRKSHFAFPKDGTLEEFRSLRNEYVENVLHKNEYIKGYYPNRHAWGSDRTDYVEAFFVNSMDDLDKMFGRNNELVKEHWPDENARKEMGEKASKYYTGVHGDYIYTVVEQLIK